MSSRFHSLLLLITLFSFSSFALCSSSPSSRTFHLFTASNAAANKKSTTATASSSTTITKKTTTAAINPLSPKAFSLRYWDRKIPMNSSNIKNKNLHPDFLTSKLSPLSAADAATFVSLAAAGPHYLTDRLSSFCSAAGLICSPKIESLQTTDQRDSSFGAYQSSNFSNYGTGAVGGLNSFKNYSEDENVPVDSFRRYSRNSVGHDDKFSSYSPNGNVVTDNFTSYATGANSGTSDFDSYADNVNNPNLKFTNYDTDSNGRQREFTGYSDNANAGDQSFSGYGKNGNGVQEGFNTYGNNSNVVGSGFANYAANGNGANDSFTSYGFNGNVPENNFRTYGSGGNGGVHTFTSYRDQSNVGDSFFTSYGKDENAAEVKFSNYGNSFNPGSDNFKGYADGKHALDHNIQFTSYAGDNTSFKGYSKTGVSFKTYKNASVVPAGMKAEDVNGILPSAVAAANHRGSRWVEPGKFFRESELKEGNVMPMPDIHDRMPPRSFLPRSIADKIPFNATELYKIFNIPEDTAMGKAIADTIGDCQRAPSRGETKKCPTSFEAMVDFAVSVLGNDAVVHSTDTSAGSKTNIMIGKVTGINGGRVTKSVSCHQSLFPYLVYYCHSVPKVRVYEADILDAKMKTKINHGFAICHLDTSDWSAGHGAFIALGHKPGEIEVCHWIFQGDMTWAAAD